MIVIPDLFGSYQKGREEAIKNNWNDLAQYESIESSRHQNDAQALANLATMADFGVRRRMVQNEGTNSDLNTQLNVAQMPAKLNIAEGDSLVTGVELATLLANPDGLKQYAADKLATAFLGAGTGYNNAVVSHGKSTMGRGIFELNYPAMYDAYNSKTRADIDMMKAYSEHMPTITRNNYRGQVYSSAGAADAAGVDYRYAIPTAEAKNIAGLKGYQASAAGSDLSKSQSEAALVTLANDLSSKYQSEITLIQERQKNYPKGSNEWNNAQLEIDTRRKAINDLGGYFGVPDLINYKPYAVSAPATTDTTSGGTGTTTYVDPSTGRAITVPYATTGVGPLASGYVPYGSNGTNLFTGSSQPRTLSEITANLTTPQQNVMGVQNIGGVPNIPTAQRTSTAVHYLPNGQRVVTTAPVSPPTQSPSQNQLIKNFNNRRGGFL